MKHPFIIVGVSVYVCIQRSEAIRFGLLSISEIAMGSNDGTCAVYMPVTLFEINIKQRRTEVLVALSEAGDN